MDDAIREKIQSMGPWLTEIRRDFHMYPELGNREFRTSKKIQEILKDLGISVTVYPDSTCVIGLIKGGKEGKTVAIRADMDALPIREKNDTPYRSKNEGIMHACGHDVHVAVLLGVARYFAENRDSLKGNIKLLFQPAEESTGGAEKMIELGCLKNPDVDAVIGLHVSTAHRTGTVALKEGTMNAASDDVFITVRGKSSHGAYPQLGTDAITVSAQIVTALQTVVSREISPLDSAVLTFGVIRGGTASNIIADKVELIGTLRTVDQGTREKAKERIEKMAKGIAEGMGATAEIAFHKGYDMLVNDPDITAVIKAAAKEVIGEENISQKEQISLGVEDFGYFAKAVKGAFYYLGCGNPDKGICAPGHNEYFDVDEDCLPIGVMMQVNTALKLLE
jgi:amidohydrolase